MRKMYILIAALAAALAGGCGGMDKVPGKDAARPLVTRSIAADSRKTAAVQPNPLVFPAGQGPVTIVWSFPPGGNLRFAENGIVIDGEITSRDTQPGTTKGNTGGQALDGNQKEIVECRIAKEGLEFSCLNRHTRPGTYKYSIQVLEDGKPLMKLDPTVANN